MRYTHAMILIGGLAWSAPAQQPATIVDRPSATATPLDIGQSFTIDSDVLHERRRINVYAPPQYVGSDTVHLPVLYMPDGGMAEDFLHIAGLVQVLVGNGTMRPFLLVGIENTERRRDLTGPTNDPQDRRVAPRVGGSADFRRFIRTELMPQVRGRFRTTAESAIVGESFAGLFVIETLLLEPDLFDTYIAFDPSLWWNSEQLTTKGGSLLQAHSYRTKRLYFASSSAAPALAERFKQVLERGATAHLAWQYQFFPEESHATIYHPAALRAFRELFKPTPRGPDARSQVAAVQPIHLTWLGHAGFEIVSPAGTRLLIDPWIDGNGAAPPAYRDSARYARRETRPDAILVTHGHGDHDGDVPRLARLSGAPVVATGDHLEAMKIPDGHYLSINIGGVQRVGDVEIHAVPAMHSVAPGHALGYVLRFADGRTLYHTGDTWAFGDMALIQQFFHPSILLFGMGGGRAGTDPATAAATIRQYFTPMIIVPMHIGTLPQPFATAADVRSAFRGDQRVHLLVPGTDVTF